MGKEDKWLRWEIPGTGSENSLESHGFSSFSGLIGCSFSSQPHPGPRYRRVCDGPDFPWFPRFSLRFHEETHLILSLLSHILPNSFPAIFWLRKSFVKWKGAEPTPTFPTPKDKDLEILIHTGSFQWKHWQGSVCVHLHVDIWMLPVLSWLE